MFLHFDTPVWSFIWPCILVLAVECSHWPFTQFDLSYTAIKKEVIFRASSFPWRWIVALYLPIFHSSRLTSTHINETATQEKKKSAESKHNKNIGLLSFCSLYPSGYVITNIYCMYWGLGDGLARTLSNHTSELLSAHLAQGPSSLHNPLICLLLEQGQLRIDKHTELDMRHAVLSYRAVREPAIVSGNPDYMSAKSHSIVKSKIRTKKNTSNLSFPSSCTL